MTARACIRTAWTLTILALTAIAVHAAAKEIPLQLPRPDGKPGDATKPVKVYILAGQSNMVGMGDLTGARPPWPSVMLSADPAIIPGMMPIGGSALATHRTSTRIRLTPSAKEGAGYSDNSAEAWGSIPASLTISPPHTPTCDAPICYSGRTTKVATRN